MNMAGKTDFKYNELIKQIIYSVQWIKQRVSTCQVKTCKFWNEETRDPAIIQVLIYALAYVWQLS